MTEDEKLKLLALHTEIHALQHAMQSGVAAYMGVPSSQPSGSKETDSKHLRVGVNAAMVNHEALVKLLVEKGVFTDIEYFTSVAQMMKLEVESYERRLSDYYGKPVTLV